MQQTLKKILILALIVSVLAPGFYFALDEVIAPKRAEAQGASCMGIVVGAILGVLGFVGGLLAVPANDAGNLVQNTSTSMSSGGSFIKDCILKPLLDRLIRKLIQEFTVSVIDWINGGFDGSPKFVSDPAGFFRNVGDSVAGATIEQFAPWLCGPIAPFVLPALAFRYSNHYFYKQEVGCRLSDIEANIDRFIRGSDPRDFSWDRWAQVTTIPQNNAFGSYLSASLIIDERIARQLKIKQDDLSFGRGYLSYQKCSESKFEIGSEDDFYEQLKIESSGKDVKEQTIDPESEEGYYARIEGRLQCKTVTPGSTIQDSLSKALGSDLDRYGVADSIDAILGALMDQAIGFVFKGLFSAGDNYESSSNQWKNNLLAYRDKTNYEAGRGAENTKTNFTQGGQTGAGEFDSSNNQNAQIIGNYYQNQQDQAVQQAKVIELYQATAEQSSTEPDAGNSGAASLALTGGGFAYSRTGEAGWWSVTLPNNEYIALIEITPNLRHTTSWSKVTVQIDGTDFNVEVGNVDAVGSVSTIPVQPARFGRKITITNTNGDLALSQVRLFRYLKPVIKLDPAFVTIKAGDAYNPMTGVTAQNINGENPVPLTSAVTVVIKNSNGDEVHTGQSEYVFATTGTYTIIYNVADTAVSPPIQSNEVKRTVTVQATGAPAEAPPDPGSGPGIELQ